MQTTPELVHQYIAEQLNCDHLEVKGDGHHFEALIVSSVFEGQRTLARHQAVYQALGTRMHEEIHALSMRTLTPAEYQTSQQNG